MEAERIDNDGIIYVMHCFPAVLPAGLYSETGK